jgi:hypothetical protein
MSEVQAQPIQMETSQSTQESTIAKIKCACGVSFTPSFGSVPGLKVLYQRVRKGVVDPLHPLTKPELLSQEFCGSRNCPAYAQAEVETKVLTKPGEKLDRSAFYTPNTLRLMADWAERNARKLAERDTLRYERQRAYEARRLELAAGLPDRGLVNRTLAEAGDRHGYHPKRKSKRLPMAERKLKARKPKSSSLPASDKKKGKKKGGDESKKKGGKGKK